MRPPTTNRITQAKHGRYNAVDYSARPDPTIYAPEGGVITAYGASGACGNRLELTAGKNRHGFCHLERPLVKVNQKVRKGQKIGIMGYTGYTIPSGPAGRHLHWVINRGNTYVYPPSLITKEKDMYKGRSAKDWYEKLIKEQKNAKKVTRIAETRGKQLNDVRKKLQAALSKPPKEVVKVVEKVVEKTKDESVVVKNWFSRLIDKIINWNKEK